MNRLSILVTLLLSSHLLAGQTLEEQIQTTEAEIQQLDDVKEMLRGQLENTKLLMVHRDLRNVGLPSKKYVEHTAMILEYSEEHEQPRWVAHVITPDITTGTVTRSNDFREDPLIETGTAVQEDYFLTDTLADGKVNYDGFGFDRGHLAPSADFRWSQRALSESYFYSNMSPQVAEFNRKGWAELEALLRGYLYEHQETQLFVVTGPILEDGLPRIQRGVNHVSIPKQFFKVAIDLKAGQAIGFLIPNQRLAHPLEHYALTIDEVEQVTGLDFFNLIDREDEIEASLDKAYWIPTIVKGDVEPIYPPSLPRAHFNTIQAKDHVGSNKAITVCGKVVGTRYSKSGNLWFNLDKQFPNQIFSVFIKKEDLINFSYDPKTVFDGQVIAVEGTIQDFSGTPTLNLKREGLIRVFE